MKISEIYVKNFKSIKEGILCFADNKTILVGKNNAGKSNYLSVLNIFFSGKYPTYCNFDENDFYNLEECIILKVKFSDGKELGLKIEYDKDKNKALKPQWIGVYPKSEELQALCSCVYIPSDRNINQELRNNSYSRYGKLLQIIFEYKKGSQAYENILKKLKEIEDEFDEILPSGDICKISKTLTYINNIKFGLSEGGKPEDLLKKVEILIDDGHGNMSLSRFGTGTQSTVMIGLLELYLKVSKWQGRSSCKIFIIDEPENYLHPHAKRLLDNVLHEISINSNTQVVLSTHSSELISNFDNTDFNLSDLRLIYKDKNETKIRLIINDEKIIHELNSYNSEVFFANTVILVEGQTDKIAIPRIFHNYKRTSTHCGPQLEHIESYINSLDIKDDEKNIELTEQIKKFFDINYHNVSIIDVGSVDSLPKWYKFSSQIVGKENVFVVQDKDIHLPEDNQINYNNIESIIKEVYLISEIKNLEEYNRYILNGEFEYQYKKEIVKQYMNIHVTNYCNQNGEEQAINAYKENFSKQLEVLYKDATKYKFSKGFALLIKNYFATYSKPAITKQIINYLVNNNGLEDGLIKILSEIIQKINKDKVFSG